MKRGGSITVFSALTFMLIASFLFALLEAGRVSHLEAYANMRSVLALESVCAEYQPKLWEDYRLLGLDGAYGGQDFSMEYVTAVLSARIRTNLNQEGAGSRMMGLELTTAYPTGYQLLTDGEGSVFLRCVSNYMKENFPIEAARILYDRYTQEETVEKDYQTEGSVENAQAAIEEARKKQQEEGSAMASGEGTQMDDIKEPEEVEENPLEVVLALKQNALLGMVTEDTENLSAKQINPADMLENRTCERGTLQQVPQTDWYDKVLALEYLDQYFADYTTPAAEHALSYELEYVLCGKESDKDNLEGTVKRLMLVREAANVTHILSDHEKRAASLAMAEALAGFTGNPAIIKAVQIGVVAAWAYVESILDIRALFRGDKIALLKSDAQWTTQLGSLSEAFAGHGKAKDCANGISYQDYVKGFLFAMKEQKFAYRMMNVMEQNIRLDPAYQYCRIDHLICRMDYEMEYAANPLFWRFSMLGKSGLLNLQFQNHKRFSYYDNEKGG